jgi:hypothetical protein
MELKEKETQEEQEQERAGLIWAYFRNNVR